MMTNLACRHLLIMTQKKLEDDKRVFYKHNKKKTLVKKP